MKSHLVYSSTGKTLEFLLSKLNNFYKKTDLKGMFNN